MGMFPSELSMLIPLATVLYIIRSRVSSKHSLKEEGVMKCGAESGHFHFRIQDLDNQSSGGLVTRCCG